MCVGCLSATAPHRPAHQASCRSRPPLCRLLAPSGLCGPVPTSLHGKVFRVDIASGYPPSRRLARVNSLRKRWERQPCILCPASGMVLAASIRWVVSECLQVCDGMRTAHGRELLLHFLQSAQVSGEALSGRCGCVASISAPPSCAYAQRGKAAHMAPVCWRAVVRTHANLFP